MDKFKMFRGGSWDSLPVSCRSADRDCDFAHVRDGHVGFRICEEVEKDEESRKLLRGGSWLSFPVGCGSTYRVGSRPNYRLGNAIGFRICEEVEEEKPTYKPLRGGCWFSLTSKCRSSYRGYYLSINTLFDVGFRICEEIDEDLPLE